MHEPSPELSNVLHFERPKLSGHRFLIVEDEVLIALALVDIVAGLGASWVAASRVAQALALIATEPFSGAILDMNLAGERADAVVDALSARDIPFIITTGYEVDAMAEKHRGRPTLHKPYLPEQVEAALIRTVSAPRSIARCA